MFNALVSSCLEMLAEGMLISCALKISLSSLVFHKKTKRNLNRKIFAHFIFVCLLILQHLRVRYKKQHDIV